MSSRGGAGLTYKPWPIRISAGGVGISTPCGEVSCGDDVHGLSELVVDVWTDSDTGM